MENTTEAAQGILIDEIEHVIKNAKKAESYLFLGKAYDAALDKALAKFPEIDRHFIVTYSVYDRDFSFNRLIRFCKKRTTEDWRFVAILRLKSKGVVYQRRLLVLLERLNVSFLVFADNDNDDLIEPFMSRFGHIKKQSNENLQAVAFIPPNKMLSRKYIASPYDCPSLIKLGDYDNLSPSNKKMDILISRLSGGNVFTEVLSELQPPIKAFDDDIKLETLSLLRQRFCS